MQHLNVGSWDQRRAAGERVERSAGEDVSRLAQTERLRFIVNEECLRCEGIGHR